MSSGLGRSTRCKKIHLLVGFGKFVKLILKKLDCQLCDHFVDFGWKGVEFWSSENGGKMLWKEEQVFALQVSC